MGPVVVISSNSMEVCHGFCFCFCWSFQNHESEIIGSQLKFSFINISIDWGGFILSDFSRLSIRN